VINHGNIIKHGQAFVPIHHHEEKHWTFVRLIAKEAGIEVEHYDSYSSIGATSGVERLRAWISKRFTSIPVTYTCCPGPQQPNDYDCGLFVLMGIRAMSSGSRHLSQLEADESMPTFRRTVLAELLANKLNPNACDREAFKSLDREAKNNVIVDAGPREYLGSGATGDPVLVDTPEGNQPLL
jgi:Ulp1 family protease